MGSASAEDDRGDVRGARRALPVLYLHLSDASPTTISVSGSVMLDHHSAMQQAANELGQREERQS